jgi:hypothetical protein
MMAAIGASGAVDVARAEEAGRAFEIYGFADADAIADSKRTDPAWQDAFRPSKIGVDGQFGTNGQSSVSVKQSRFGVKGTMPADGGGLPISFKFEFDLFGTGADEGKTTFHLRHAYGEWGSLLAGQTDSAFKDPDVFPNVIDYWGPMGYLDKRNVQIRWTGYRTASDHFAIAIENPGNDVDAGNIRLIEEYQYADVRNDEKLPDLTLHFRHNGDWGHAQAGGILRQVAYEYRVSSSEPWRKGSQTGWGVNLSAGIKTVGKDQILLQVAHGDGIASYICDGGMDIAPNAGPTGAALSAKAVPLTGALAYYDHYWNSMWSSSIGYSVTQVDNTNFQSPTAYHKGDYASVNLLATPAADLLLGGELLWGKRTNNDGTSGDDVRFQFTVKYKFGARL